MEPIFCECGRQMFQINDDEYACECGKVINWREYIVSKIAFA